MGPTVNGRASICQWELAFYFRDKDQIRQFVKLLMKDEINFDFEHETTFDDTGDLYHIIVKGCWANNLGHIAKMLEKIDYKDV